jgi:hypothetical protein
VFECVGDNYYNQADCESSGNAWIQIGNDCSGDCDGRNFSCIECPTDDNAALVPLNCATATAAFGCGDSVYGDLSVICPETCNDAPCINDMFSNTCHEEEIDECGLCYGTGVGEDYCDCYDNIENCAGDCPTIYSGVPGIWIINEEFVSSTDEDIDGCTSEEIDEMTCVEYGDGICDDVDECVSTGAEHLIFTEKPNPSAIDASITDMYFPSKCSDVCIGNDDGTPGINR